MPPKTQLLVIDSPAAVKRKRLEELVRIADIIVLPVLPSVFDEITTRRFLATLDKLKPVRKGKRPIAVVGNRVRPRTRTAARLEDFLGKVGQRSVASLRDTQLYPASARRRAIAVRPRNAARGELRRRLATAALFHRRARGAERTIARQHASAPRRYQPMA